MNGTLNLQDLENKNLVTFRWRELYWVSNPAQIPWYKGAGTEIRCLICEEKKKGKEPSRRNSDINRRCIFLLRFVVFFNNLDSQRDECVYSVTLILWDAAAIVRSNWTLSTLNRYISEKLAASSCWPLWRICGDYVWNMKWPCVFRELNNNDLCPSEDFCVLRCLSNTYAICDISGLRWRHSCCLRIIRQLGWADPSVIRTDVIAGQVSECLTVGYCNKCDIFHLAFLQTQGQLLLLFYFKIFVSTRPYFCSCTSCRDKINV